MMKKLLIILSILTFNLNLTSQDKTTNRWHIIKGNYEQGFIDSIGNEIFIDRFEWLDKNYHDGLVFFKKNGEIGFLDKDGKIAFLEQNASYHFSNQLLPIEEETGFKYINTNGKIEIDFQQLELPKGKEISKIYSFKDGLAMVRVKNQGFIDKIDSPSDVVFAENVNLYPGNWFYGFINKSGQWAIDPIYDSATSFNDSISIVDKNNETLLIDTKGNIITNLKDLVVSDYSEGFAIVYSNEGWYFVNQNGQRLGNKIFQRANPFSEGMASIKVDGYWGFIDTLGNILIEPKYYVRSDFKEGLAPVSIRIEEPDGSSHFIEAFINKDGDEIIKFRKHVDYGNFENGIAKGRRFIYNDKKKYTGYYELFYINKRGKKIWSEVLKQ